jgi:hypothetical protein
MEGIRTPLMPPEDVGGYRKLACLSLNGFAKI